MKTPVAHRSRTPLTWAVAILAVLIAAALTFSSAPRAAVGNQAQALETSPIVDMPDPVLIAPMEVPRDGSAEAPTLPPEEPIEPVLEGRPPAPALGSGVLVRTFPSIVPLYKPSSVLTSTVTSSGGIVQGTFDATARVTCTQIQSFYAVELAESGLASIPLDAASRADSVSFTRANDSVTLTLAPAPDGSCRYSVFAVLTTAS